MTVEQIIDSWKKSKFAPIYLFHGEEDYFIDELVDYAEHKLLTPDQAEFNLTIYYGKDANWSSVINSCRRYPMFSDKQLVLLKEAQYMRDLDKLESYIDQPLSSTIFIIAHKGKTLDKRTKFAKQITKSGVEFKSDKVADYKVRDWVGQYLKSQSLTMDTKALQLFVDHVGNDLSRLVGEINKLKINLKERTSITTDDIETFIGISKEFNIFELQAAIVNRDLTTAIRIINYFEANPKAAPLQAALPGLYSFVSKVYAAYGLADTSDQGLRAHFYHNFSAVEQGKTMMRNYQYHGLEKIILLLHHYSMKGVGIGDSGTEHALLLKELVVKIILS